MSVLTAVDDIQVMLDDHILKAQTMRGSPYVKAFEEEMQNWESKLISMQDIIDAWLAVSFLKKFCNFSQYNTLKSCCSAKVFGCIWNQFSLLKTSIDKCLQKLETSDKWTKRGDRL